MQTDIFNECESVVRSYCRRFPKVFSHATGSWLLSEDGERYLDFFSGAGALNYGHNHPRLKEALITYLKEDGVIHSLDLHTVAKRRFLELFKDLILRQRGLDYKVQFPGPTGTNAVEAAVKLARKVTGRENIIAFTNAFHGMTLGALALSGNSFKRHGAGITLSGVTRMPFDNYSELGPLGLGYLDAVLQDKGSGIDVPAAIIIETIQAEGGINVATDQWLRELERIAHLYDIVLIVDDIQVGCGRTGPFFSFESAGITPDMVVLSKSLSGYGLPLSVVLIRSELDQWEPGEHNGTFRGNNAAFVTAAAALGFWGDDSLEMRTRELSAVINTRLMAIAEEHDGMVEVRGRGMIQGLRFHPHSLGLAEKVSQEAFKRGLLVETAGVENDVLKLLPSLLVEQKDLQKGLDIVEESVNSTLSSAVYA